MLDISLGNNLIYDKLFFGIKIQLSFFESHNEKPTSGVLVVKSFFLTFSTCISSKLEIHT